MLELSFASYLLFVLPFLSLRRSLKPAPTVRAPLLRRDWRQGRHAALLLAVLAGVEWHAGRSLGDLGLGVPLSSSGRSGLIAAACLIVGLHVAGMAWERFMTPAAREAQRRKLADASLPWPDTTAESVAFVLSTSLMCAGWEVLYRGFLLLVLAPHVGLPLAVAAAALAYGVAHGYKSRGQLIGSIVSAFVFTIAYAWTHSLWWLMAIHVAMPLSALASVRKARRAYGVVAPEQP